MDPALTPEILSRLEDPSVAGVVPLNGSLGPAIAVVGAGGRSRRETDEAVAVGRNETEKARGRGLKQAGRSLARATRAVGRLLGIGKVTKEPQPDPPR